MEAVAEGTPAAAATVVRQPATNSILNKLIFWCTKETKEVE